jgi:site-specific DNA-methyltransferase (adenine-specific)
LKTTHKVIVGDSRFMREVPDESVHLVITSPPYWQLKDYGSQEQIGFNDTYQEYTNNLNLVWMECLRVLHQGCRLCINIGDQFARSVYYGRYKVIPIRTEIIKFCEAAGFDYMGAIVWQKVTTCNTTGGATVMGSYPYPRSGILKLDYEFILIFRKYGKQPRVKKEIKEKSRLTKEEWNQYFTGHWSFPGEKQNKHLAMFPAELPRRLVKMFSFIGDTVLDPFLGSGTTSLAAMNLTRNSVGYEINEGFLPSIKRRIGTGKKDLWQEGTLEIVKQRRAEIDVQKEIEKLPYVFKDPVHFDKKVDPKTQSFGSRIDRSGDDKQAYSKVTRIISPKSLVLDDGLRVRLLGIKEIPKKNREAIEFLKKKTQGQKLVMKFDSKKYDEQRNLLCYLYLRNRTFLNAHLIKKGLADVDMSLDYRHKARFLEYKKRSKR